MIYIYLSPSLSLSIYIYIYNTHICVCICICICMLIYVCMCIYIYIYTDKKECRPGRAGDVPPEPQGEARCSTICGYYFYICFYICVMKLMVRIQNKRLFSKINDSSGNHLHYTRSPSQDFRLEDFARGWVAQICIVHW